MSKQVLAKIIAEESTSVKLANIASDETKNTLTLTEKTVQFEAAIVPETFIQDIDTAHMSAIAEDLILFPVHTAEKPFNGLNMGDADIQAALLKVPDIAGKIKLVGWEKTETYTTLTVSVTKFDAASIGYDVNMPMTVRYQKFTLYRDGMHSVGKSELASSGCITKTGPKGRIPSVKLETFHPLFQWTYGTSLAAYERLDNAVRVVTEQAKAGLPLKGHDETMRGNVREFIKTFAKAKVKSENKGASDAEIQAKAEAQRLAYEAMIANL